MSSEPTKVAVTGAAGFIGRNLVVRLQEQGVDVREIVRETPPDEARGLIGACDVLFHLAGANRPQDPNDFIRCNVDFAAHVAAAIADGGRKPLVVCSSTAKATADSPYGRSKLAGESVMLELAERGKATVAIYRLPNVFGKWARPNYNSAVATFCHNLTRGLAITIDDPDAKLDLLYVDDLIDQWIALVRSPPQSSGLIEPAAVHQTTVGAVAAQLRAFAGGRMRGEIEAVGSGLARALYATFVSALPEEAFSYGLQTHVDARGQFAEVVKTATAGQVSFLTALPGVTRGGHYHHSKVEKFVIVHGEARFRFRNILNGATHELMASADRPMVVETVPGWTHDVTNVGEEPLVALVWANERFDPARPDTVAAAL